MSSPDETPGNAGKGADSGRCAAPSRDEPAAAEMPPQASNRSNLAEERFACDWALCSDRNSNGKGLGGSGDDKSEAMHRYFLEWS